MINTLCIETSGPHCSLALSQGGHVYCSERHLERRHNEELLPLLDDLFAQAQMRPKDVDLVAFGAGPGSFTGVRIAASACQAIALVASARVVAVRSSWILAQTAFHQLSVAHRAVVSLPSRGQAYYLSAAQRQDASLRVTHTDQLVDAPPDWLSDVLDTPDSVWIGQPPDWLPKQYTARCTPGLTPAAEHMLDFARAEYQAGRSLSVEGALPVYIEGDSPWRKQKHKSVTG